MSLEGIGLEKAEAMGKVIESASSRPGAMFLADKETALYPSALRAAEMIRLPLLKFIAEMPGPIGVPDFVGLYGGDQGLKRRLNSAIPALTSPIYADILSVLYTKRPLHIGSIAQRLSWTKMYTASKLIDLERVGGVQKNPNGAWLRAEEIASFGTIIAFETKLRDWRSAILQGRSYRTWADNAVLVVGELGPKASIEITKQSQAEGWGLYMNSKLINHPLRRRVPANKALLAREHLIAALGHHTHPSALRNRSNPSR